ncbi:hypothetical protein DFH07DRAFT_781815 [Mycena maculata]|uniref:Uncharacterized protein n=1 Tax=Mycena maculata TaxID=230809 RepID=A0AAD7HWB7_9AGAR|nr:hypothetical protein DFH07DRAFT_781815 [Mycena maculata]
MTESDNFRSLTVLKLSYVLKNESPSEGLITMMRNQNFQHSLFLNVDLDERWPQADSPYPRDLIQLWEDHSFVATFTRSLLDSMPNSEHRPSFNFDWIYQEIFTGHPNVLLVLRPLMPSDDPTSRDLKRILDLYGMTYRIFQPFARFRQFIQFPFPEGDSPLDFLADPGRAGVLYCNPGDLVEDYMLLWTHRAKEVLSEAVVEPILMSLRRVTLGGPIVMPLRKYGNDVIEDPSDREAIVSQRGEMYARNPWGNPMSPKDDGCTPSPPSGAGW